MMKSICIEIVRRCHLKCRHCSASSSSYMDEKITIEDLKRLLDNIYRI